MIRFTWNPGHGAPEMTFELERGQLSSDDATPEWLELLEFHIDTSKSARPGQVDLDHDIARVIGLQRQGLAVAITSYEAPTPDERDTVQ